MGQGAEYIVVFVTAGSPEEAKRIGDALLRERLAACVNVVPSVKSSFWWRGEIEECEEALLIAKSKAGLLERVIECVRRNHSYSVPEVIAVPIMGGYEGYLKWLEEACEGG